MRCRECESLLWAYIDDELGESARRSVAAHLAGCAQCGREYDRLRSFPIQAGRVGSVPPPPDFTARLMQRITPLPPPRELAAQQERARANGWHGPVGMLVAFSTATAAVLLGLLSTSALALAGGGRLPGLEIGNSATGIANAIGVGVAIVFWQQLSWSIIGALAGMLATLALLWFRVVNPRRPGRATYRAGAPQRLRH